jgi:hypothetical protein
MTESNARATDRATVVGIAATGSAVGAFSSFTLFTTAHSAGVPAQLAWVLPVATDLAALVATRVWLSARYPQSIRRYAATIAIAAMTLSFIGASLHYAIDGSAPWWLRMAVGGLPSLSLAAIAHLGALIAADRAGKRSAQRNVSAPEVAARPPVASPEAPGALTPALTPAPSTESVAVGVPAPRAERDNVISMTEGRGGEKGEKRARMFAYLDSNPGASGAELDRVFGTRDYGRTIRRDWTRARKQPKVSGE